MADFDVDLFVIGGGSGGVRAARIDHSGRLVIDGGADLAAKLARGVALIYVQKVLR